MSWLLFWMTAEAATRNVGPGQTYATIAAAVDAASDGDIIAVSPGIYDEVVVVDGVDLTFSALGTVEWIGQDSSLLQVYRAEVSILGFTFHPDGGRGVRLEDADVEISGCEFSGNNGGDRAYNGAALVLYEGSSAVVSNSAFFDNHTEAPFFGGGIDGWGGHIHVRDSELEVIDSTFTDGSAVEGGAIHAIEDAVVTVSGCTFTDHTASDRGGAIYLGQGSLTVTDSAFENSVADALGGVLRWSAGFYTGQVTFERNTFLTSRAGDFGGLMALNTVGALRLFDNVILDSSSEAGGALSVFNANEVEARRNLFCNSRADEVGGAVRVSESGEGVWTNNIFIRSTAAGDDGGAFWISASDAQQVINNDLLDSSSGGSGGAIRVENGASTLINNLFGWTQSGTAVSASGGTLALSYGAWFNNQPSDTAGGLSRGAGAVQADPGLLRYIRNPLCSDDDLRLRVGSPLINAGDPAITDPDGTRSDIGAYGGPEADPELFDDGDGDGTVAAYDCDDTRADVRPGAVEACDGVDNDCDGRVDQPSPPGAPTWHRDRDGDGFGDDADFVVACEAPAGYVDLGGDCDDTRADIAPLVDERCDGVDNDCNGTTDGSDAVDQLTWYADADEDGFGTAASSISACNQPVGYALSSADCDDADAAINPAADERCDDVDNNCDGATDGDDAIDRLPWYADGDSDGWGVGGPGTILACDAVAGASRYDTDCDDGDPTVYPYAPEDCTSDVDRNCDGSTGDADLDGDGVRACEDCDDTDPLVFPGAEEVWYDGVITDCTSASDFDADRDGFDSAAWGGDDCDDTSATVNPGVAERLDDEIDNDCDGQIGVDLSYDEDLKLGCGGCDGLGGRGVGWGVALGVVLGLRRRRG